MDGTHRRGPPGPADAPTERSPLHDIATVEVHETIVAAPSAGDFGHFGAWVFALDSPVDPALVPTLVPTLPMACVEGLGPSTRFEIARRPLTDIWQILFSTASMGGTYGRGPRARSADGRPGGRWRGSAAPLSARAPNSAVAQLSRTQPWWMEQRRWPFASCGTVPAARSSSDRRQGPAASMRRGVRESSRTRTPSVSLLPPRQTWTRRTEPVRSSGRTRRKPQLFALF
ncbi:DUF6183 family protein [Streptomyces xantholiticus]|uniref:DUF6183 family protein n=1 Tax=Streptomyces xantholiticus TaxID=68285 RepID=UPI0035716322